jgi:hypothetical protein
MGMILPVGGTSYGRNIDISSGMACLIVLENYRFIGRTFVLHVRALVWYQLALDVESGFQLVLVTE